MEHDDNIRSKHGLAVCLRDMGDGTSRIFFDDVDADRLENPIKWNHAFFYTFTPELENVRINKMGLTDQQFQEIGESVVARLLALNGRTE